MMFLGIGLIVSGSACVILGIIILALAAIQLRKQMFPTAVAPGAPGVSLPDLTNLIQAIVKVPQWLLAILAMARFGSGFGPSPISAGGLYNITRLELRYFCSGTPRA
jgi:hypothetical protein